MNEERNTTRRVDFATFSIDLLPDWKGYGGPVPVNCLEQAEMQMRCMNFCAFDDAALAIRIQLIEVEMDGLEGAFISGYLAEMRAIEDAPKILPKTLDGIEASQAWRVCERIANAEYVVYRARTGATIILECHTPPLEQDEVASARTSVGRLLDSWRWAVA